MKHFNISILPAFLLLAGSVFAQNVRYDGTKLVREGQEVHIHTQANLEGIGLKSNQMLLLTPTIVSKDGKQQIEMKPLAICGPNRYKVMRREVALHNISPALAEAQMIRYDKTNASTPIMIHERIPYQTWMQRGKVIIKERMIGCASCGLAENQTALAAFRNPAEADYVLRYTAPAEEVKKIRSVKLDAYLNFVVNRSELKRDYKSNAQELDKIDKFVTSYARNGHVKIDQMSVTGYASPEGSEKHNLALSDKRAIAVADFLKQTYADRGLPTLQVKGMGEDWETLRRLIAESDLPKKEDFLKIIDSDTYPDADRKEAALRALPEYATIMKTFYPMCRRNDVKVDFTAQPLTLEDAQSYIKTQPELLSEAEMYRVAESYPADSRERYEAFEIAHRYFAKSITARTNLAVYYLENGKTQDAIALLEPVANQPGVNNLLGVAYARTEQFDKAEAALRKAVAEGDIVANENLKRFIEG